MSLNAAENTIRSRALQWLGKRWFVLAMALVVAAAGAFPDLCRPAAALVNVRLNVVIVMTLMSLTLDSSHLVAAIRRPGAVLLGVVCCFLFVPLYAFIGGKLLLSSIIDLRVGLLVIACIPCTLASASIWTRLAGGNDALSLLVTVVSNSAAPFVTPLLLLLALGRSVSLDPRTMMAKLLVVILIPVAVGQLLRLWPQIAARADAAKPVVSVVTRCIILTIVLTAAERASLRLRALGHEAPWSMLLWTAIAALTVHLLAAVTAYSLARISGLAPADCTALTFAGSQKTLPVSLYVVDAFFAPYGLAVAPVLLYHILQLTADTWLVDVLRARHRLDEP